MEYFLILMAFLASTIIMKWKRNIRIYGTRREMAITTSVIFAICIVWDYFAAWRGHWSFQGPGLLGIWVGWLPVEEFLFILIIPVWLIAVYKVINEKKVSR